MSALFEIARAPSIYGRIEKSGRWVWRTIIDALAASRRKQADEIIAGMIAMQGGRFNDDIERRIGAKLSGR